MIARPIPPPVLDLIESIIDHLPEADRSVLLAQARSADVVEEIPGRAIDFVVDSGASRSSTPDGPVQPIPAVIGQDGRLVGELILWIQSGYLIGLEQPWFGESPLELWPRVSDLDFS